MCMRNVRIAVASFVLVYLAGIANAQFRFSGREFSIDSRVLDGISVRYTQGIVVLTMNSKDDHDVLRSLVAEWRGEILRSWNPTGTDELDVTMQIPTDYDPFHVAQELKNNSFVKHAEPNYVSTMETNDTHYSQQWSLSQSNNADINAPEAWSVSTGSSSVIIAVLDTGIPMSGSSLTHEDLDNSSHIVLVSGVDIYDSDDDPEDDYGHGTAVSGISGAETNNSLGIAGVGYQCKLMPIKVAAPSVTPQLFKSGVYKAFDNGANVINFSHSFDSGSSYLTDAIQYAKDNDCLIVVAAGNQNASVRYPGYYSTSYNNLMAIAATDDDDVVANFSNQGLWINVAAPGVDIITTDIPGGPGYESGDYTLDGVDGTSFSAPHVAGSAGLILSVNGSLSPSTTRAILQFTAKDLGDFGFDEDYGWGRINAYDAARSADEQFTLSGTLPKNECWYGTVTLNGNVTIPTNRTLGIASGTTVYLNGYYIKSTGGVFAEESNVTWSPADVRIVESNDLKGHYKSIEAALANATSGQTVLFTSDTITENNNLTIGTGVVLKLQPGTTLEMANGKKITVNGTLNALGTASDKITFTASSGTWYGIEVNSSGHFNPTHCNFEDASLAIRYYGVYADVSYCVFTEYSTAIKYDNGSSGRLSNSSMTEFGATGIECTQYSDPEVWGYNEFEDNYYGVKGDATSWPRLGEYAAHGNNGFANLFWDVYSTNSTTIMAEYNWWGSSSPDPLVSSNVDYTPYLTSDPVPKSAAPPRQLTQPAEVIASTDTTGTAELNAARRLLSNGDEEGALALFLALTDKYADFNSGRQAFTSSQKVSRKLGRNAEAKSKRDSVATKFAGKEIAGVALLLEVGDLIKDGDFKDAVAVAETVHNQYAQTSLEKYALYDLGTLHWYYLQDQKNGETYYRKLIAAYPDDDLANSALVTLGEWQPKEKSQLEIEQTAAASEEIPTEFTLFANHPNPFNPSTQIVYSLPEAGNVTLKIFNALGEVVFESRKEGEKAGRGIFHWDGKDRYGAIVASGLYLYRILFTPENASNAMVLRGKMSLLK